MKAIIGCFIFLIGILLGSSISIVSYSPASLESCYIDREKIDMEARIETLEAEIAAYKNDMPQNVRNAAVVFRLKYLGILEQGEGDEDLQHNSKH